MEQSKKGDIDVAVTRYHRRGLVPQILGSVYIAVDAVMVKYAQRPTGLFPQSITLMQPTYNRQYRKSKFYAQLSWE